MRILALVVALSLTWPSQDLPKARALLEQALHELQPPLTTGIATPAALDAGIAAAAPGAVLTLSSTLVYTEPLTLRKAVTLQSVVPVQRMDAVTPLPKFMAGLTISADDVTVIGVEVRNPNPLTDVVTFSGARVVLDRIRVLGDVSKGAKRGIAANGGGACVIRRSYVDDCFQASPGNDSQAIAAWDMAPGLLIEDCFLRGGSETILLGGSDPVSEARMPRNITVRGNWISAKPEWMGKPIGVKTRFEIKAAVDVLVEKNVIEYVWLQGQGGYLASLTTRNQGKHAPWSTIQNVVIRDNEFAHGAGALNILALDDTGPSVAMRTVTITGNRFTDLDPAKYRGGSSKMIQVSGGPTDLTIDANSFQGVGLSSVLYFYGAVASAVNLRVTNNTWPHSTYGVFGAGASVGKAWPMFVVSGTLANNVETP